MILGHIGARKGSKGVPNKNFGMLCGKHLIDWSLDHLFDSPPLLHASARFPSNVVNLVNDILCGGVLVLPGRGRIEVGSNSGGNNAWFAVAVVRAFGVLIHFKCVLNAPFNALGENSP